MGKVIPFTPKYSVLNSAPKDAEVINIEASFSVFLLRAIVALNQGRFLRAIKMYNKALDGAFEHSEYPYESHWKSILMDIYGATGNFELMFNTLCINNGKISEMDALTMWAIIKLSKNEKRAERLKKHFINGKVVDASIFAGAKANEAKIDKSYNINTILDKIILNINDKQFDTAFEFIDIAYQLDRGDPLTDYLYFNADDAYGLGKMTKTLPIQYISKRLNEIENACATKESFTILLNQNNSLSLVRFLTNYGNLDLNAKVLRMLLNTFNPKYCYLINDALICSGKNVLKKQLLLFYVASGVPYQVFTYKGLPRQLKINLIDQIQKMPQFFDRAVIQALNSIIEFSDDYLVDLTYEISLMIKGVNSQNKDILKNVELISDLLVFLYFYRHHKDKLKQHFKNFDIFKDLAKDFGINIDKHYSDKSNLLLFKNS